MATRLGWVYSWRVTMRPGVGGEVGAVSDPAVIGRAGHVTVATRGAGGAGEVQVSVRGGIETYLAWSDEPLLKGAAVLVIGTRGPRTVDVVPWTDTPALHADC